MSDKEEKKDKEAEVKDEDSSDEIPVYDPATEKPEEVAPEIPADGAAPTEPVPTEPPATEAAPAPEAMAVPAAAPSASVSVAAPPEPVSASAPAPAAPPEEAPNIESTITPRQRAAEKTAQNANFYQDVTAGHIPPKTYHDLYENKSTLGKIGTLFGLMVSGAGSGLTHQPNVLMEMMNKELERDLEAQKTSKQNKQNWYRMAMEHERMLPEVAEKIAHARGAEEDAKTKAWLNIRKGITDQSAGTSALNYSSAASLGYIQNMIDMMPPGEKKDSWQATLDNQLLTGFLAKATKRNLDTEEGKAVVEAMNPPPVTSMPPPPTKGAAEPGKRYAAYNQGALAKGAEKGRLLGADAGQVKGAIPPSAVPELEKEAQALQAHRNTYADAVDAFYKLDKMPQAGQSVGVGIASGAGDLVTGLIHGGSSVGHAGEGIKSKFELARTTQMQALIGKLTKVGMPADEARAMVEAWMPSAYDKPAERQEKFEQIKKHFTGMPVETPAGLMNYGLYYSPPNYVFKSSDRKVTAPNEFAPEKTSEKPAVRMGERKE